MSAGLDILIKGVQDLADYRVRGAYDALEQRGVASPIEKYFCIALQEACLFTVSLGSRFRRLTWATESVDAQELQQWQIHIWAQARVLDWPADFVLGTLSHDGKRTFAIVECDGHDFHERTKEQAERDRSRDRRVQEMGWRIFRFTGSELYQRAVDIALDEIVTKWAGQIWDPHP